MASPVVSSEPLLSCPWVPVDVGGAEFLCKSWFGQTQYHILLMDHTCLWEERMEANAIQDRAQELNRRLRASIESFFSHLVAVVGPYLAGSGWGGQSEAQVTLQRRDGHMTLRLKSELAGLPFYWEFHCSPAPVTAACVQLVRPLLVMSSALQRHVELLGKLLERKDAEIQDYRENGAQLTRERLQTEPFEEDAFREDFMAKTLPSLLSQHQTSLNFDADLQRLYSCIMSQQNTTKRKRRHSEGEDSKQDGAEASTLTQNHAAGDGSAAVKPSQMDTERSENTKTQTPKAKKTTLPTMQQSVPSSLSATEKPASKPKKKKVGLFR